MEGRQGTVNRVFRDRSLIMGRGGGLQNGKIGGLKRFAPLPQDRVKLVTTPPPPPHF